jgi:hypothetical protein
MIDAPIDSTGTISVKQENGNTTVCSWSYTSTPGLLGQGAISLISLPGDSATYPYQTSGNLKMEVQVQGEFLYSAPKLRFASGQISPAWNNIISTDIGHSPAMSYIVSSGGDIVVTEETQDYELANNEVSASEKNNDFINYVLSLVGFIISFVVTLVYWIKFFFVDHLSLTVALYIGITGAMAFNNTRDIFKAVSKFISYQRKLYEFIIALWDTLVRIISSVRGMFKFI